ncbi:hypothetical protein DVH05_000664, partial [Phytophthora capsici]
INTVRRAYTCDCKTRWEIGWVCEHVLATMSLLSRMDLEESNRSIPVGRRSGRPRKTRALERDCRERDRSDKGFFSKSNLIKILTESPARVYNWPLIKEFTYNEDGHTSLHNHHPLLGRQNLQPRVHPNPQLYGGTRNNVS